MGDRHSDERDVSSPAENPHVPHHGPRKDRPLGDRNPVPSLGPAVAKDCAHWLRHGWLPRVACLAHALS